jgi:hypothetical protein
MITFFPVLFFLPRKLQRSIAMSNEFIKEAFLAQTFGNFQINCTTNFTAASSLDACLSCLFGQDGFRRAEDEAIAKNTLVSSAGVNYPLCERDVAVNELVQCWTRYFSSSGSADKSQYAIPICGGASGLGKSRFLQDAWWICFPRLNRPPSEQWLPVLVTFSNRTSWSDLDALVNDVECSVSVRILYASIVSPKRSFMSFFEEYIYMRDRPLLRIRDTLKYISKQLGVSGFYLAIDEFNKIVGYHAVFLRTLVAAISVVITHDVGYYVLPLFGGTSVDAIEEAVSISIHPWVRLPLPLLSDRSCLLILESHLCKEWNLPSISVTRFMAKLVREASGFPRYLETCIEFIKSLGPYAVNTFSKHEYETGLRQLNVSTGRVSGADFAQIFALSLLDVPVARSQRCNSTYESLICIGDIEQSGLISLEEKGMRSGAFHIRMPYVLVRCIPLLLRCSHPVLSKCLSTILSYLDRDGEEIGWNDFEKIQLEFCCLRCECLTVASNADFAVANDIFPGARYGPGFCDSLPVHIRNGRLVPPRICDSLDPFTEDGISFVGGFIRKSACDSNFFLSAPNAPFDSFSCHLDSESVKGVLIMHQCKHVSSPIHYEDRRPSFCLADEVRKSMSAVSTGAFSDWVKIHVCFVSDLVVFDENAFLEEGSIVYDSESLKQFYGPIFASRQAICFSDCVVDINVISERDLRTRIRNIGKALSDKICRAREEKLFESVDDLKQRVPGLPIKFVQKCLFTL